MENPLFTIKGKVITGAKRGKLLGFPTANIKLNQNIPEGIYISTVEICHSVLDPESSQEILKPIRQAHGPEYIEGQVQKDNQKAVTFIGASKTFNETEIKAETYILEFDQNIYGQTIEVNLLKKIRDNKKFSLEKELIDQMNKDIKEAKKYFNLI